LSIRTFDKDHLRDLAQPLALIEAPKERPEEPVNPLQFWTEHSQNRVFVDLNVFAVGQAVRPSNGKWSGPFNARSKLIGELAPALRELLTVAAEDTVDGYVKSLRAWWRVLDGVDAAVGPALATDPARFGVADLAELHRQAAMDKSLARKTFSPFVRVANLARRALGLPELYWIAPDDSRAERDLLPQREMDQVRFALKRGWYAAVDRWARAEQLLVEDGRTGEEERLAACYRVLRSCVESTGMARPSREQLEEAAGKAGLSRDAFVVADAFRGLYPDSVDVRMAFHCCLASTGWNPATLLALDAGEPIIEPHPKDPLRYLMKGYKARAKSEQVTEGLLKSQGSAGVIVQTLVAQTRHLRAQLKSTLAAAEAAYAELCGANAPVEARNEARTLVNELEQGLRTVWLYAAPNHGIAWLKASNYSAGAERGATFLGELVAGINARLPLDRQVGALQAKDFRAAFAEYAYRVSGGMVLFVMKALGHKGPGSTRAYLDTTVVNEQCRQLYRTFSEALWHEIRVHRRLDPTVIALHSRDGAVTDEQRQRLQDYRALKRSRLGVGCKDPANPPRRVAPNFVPGGKRMCGTQRCTLCIENAVLLPESLDGLCMRMAELRYLRENMPTATFIESSFPEEHANTEAALSVFDEQAVRAAVKDWELRIQDGRHTVLVFDGGDEA
jgi:hypothetical protein